MAFSFFKRGTGQKLRIVLKQALKRDVDRTAMQEHILSAPLDELFDFNVPAFELPEMARIFPVCLARFAVRVPRRTRLMEGKKVCLDCFEDSSVR